MLHIFYININKIIKYRIYIKNNDNHEKNNIHQKDENNHNNDETYPKNGLIKKHIYPNNIHRHAQKDTNNNGFSSNKLDKNVLIFYQNNFVYPMVFVQSK